ncbi:hypothetical protein FAM09_12565 [Niastella caeni]|uniref:Copper-binding protein MbnP-like domain-containing protein n=1 Tax=Niastella caeni TaxID=2569763 RepID=A0A4S8HUQ1_9BACT|nr:MbnP family protein [Niastella caeni]THU39337.1 hypothetical protein FAM09_12565 [Niastella caeni]
MRRDARLLITLMIACVLSGCQKEKSSRDNTSPEGKITLSFEHSVKNNQLVFGQNYTNDLGENFTVDRFKYYVHDIKLVNNKNKATSLSTGYFLVDHENAASSVITLNAPADTFTSIIYTLGVDSARNVSGAQTGALDPTHGMFWTWSSGYVMAKLEGHSPVSPLSGQAFSLHIGGFKTPYITIRQIQLPLPVSLVVAKNTSHNITVNADVNTWFSRVHSISIAKNPACHSPGQLANDIADNYEGMFTVKRIF